MKTGNPLKIGDAFTFGRVVAAIDAQAFAEAFRRWVSKASRRTGKVDATPRPRFMPPLRRYAGYLYKNNTRSLETTVRKRVR